MNERCKKMGLGGTSWSSNSLIRCDSRFAVAALCLFYHNYARVCKSLFLFLCTRLEESRPSQERAVPIPFVFVRFTVYICLFMRLYFWWTFWCLYFWWWTFWCRCRSTTNSPSFRAMQSLLERNPTSTLTWKHVSFSWKQRTCIFSQ